MMGWHIALTRTVQHHLMTKEHRDAMNLYHEARGAKRRQNQDIAIDATVTATLSAYTIAKQGLPLTSQFPLMMLAEPAQGLALLIMKPPPRSL
ncbi:unnamed protein product [Strongylus vulgaris]|uniref:Uncharacterized protein n=1 Tax=Strongylus vulgaris TaxID=40348 RepID=A0A3P7KB06_STRVU|nr:unnamed protein product [Strongylus vulgaris]